MVNCVLTLPWPAKVANCAGRIVTVEVNGVARPQVKLPGSARTHEVQVNEAAHVTARGIDKSATEASAEYAVESIVVPTE